jgi:hypothetical protein
MINDNLACDSLDGKDIAPKRSVQRGCTRPRRWGLLLIGMALCLAIGCDGGRPARVVVSGVVTYRGQPVDGASVTFIPTGARPAAGATDPQGRFTLQTFDPSDGAIVGQHVVCVAKAIPDPTDQRDSLVRRHISVLPARYASPVSSPLKADVTAGGPNDFRFDLVD